MTTLEIVWTDFGANLEDLSVIAQATADQTDDWIRWDFRFESIDPISIRRVYRPNFAPDLIDGNPFPDSLFAILPVHDG